MLELSVTFLVLVPVVVGFVEVLKRALKLSTRFAPLVSLLSGVVAVYLASDFVISGAIILQGVVLGLTACGLYAGGKKTFTNS